MNSHKNFHQKITQCYRHCRRCFRFRFCRQDIDYDALMHFNTYFSDGHLCIFRFLPFNLHYQNQSPVATSQYVQLFSFIKLMLFINKVYKIQGTNKVHNRNVK